MNINVHSFHISTSHASLDLGVNKLKTFVLQADHSLDADDLGHFTAMSLWSDNLQGDPPTLSNIKGRFTNQYTDKNDSLGQVQITGALTESIQAFNLFSNYNNIASNSDDYSAKKLRVFETGNNIQTPATLEVGTLSEFIEGANLTVKLVTETINME